MSTKQVACVRTRALEFIRPMRGRTQSQLMRCSGDEYYVVKFRNNPHGAKCLANDLLGTMLAEVLGLPVPKPAIVKVDEFLIRYTDGADIYFQRRKEPCKPGLCFGSHYPMEGKRLKDNIWDWLSFSDLDSVTNLGDFVGMLVFDKWTGNTDNRQAVFFREDTPRPNSPYYGYRALMIDQDCCFNGDKWDFPDRPSSGLFPKYQAYSKVDSFEPFEVWIERLDRKISRDLMEDLAAEIPPEWYENDSMALGRLLEELDERRAKIRHLLVEARCAVPNLFPAWVDRVLSALGVAAG